MKIIELVSDEAIHFVDNEGNRLFIDLIACNRSFSPPDKTVGDFYRRCVGWRDLSAGRPYVEFPTEPRTAFEFDSFDQAYKQLLNPLAKAGWHTLDLS